MKFCAISQQTAEWLLGKNALLNSIHKIVISPSHSRLFSESDFAEGPIRISSSSDNDLLVIWNVDYLSGTGEESWGVILCEGECSLSASREISREVFERCLYVIKQRLQGLIIDGAYIHRAYPDGTHTCLAARGNGARQFSICYVEHRLDFLGAKLFSLLCVGPSRDFTLLSQCALSESRGLDKLVVAANSLINPIKSKRLFDKNSFQELRAVISPYQKNAPENEYRDVEVKIDNRIIKSQDAYRTIGLSYREWIEKNSPLNEVQRRILNSDSIKKHPLRIIGPAGSGKTLLMQLLSIKRLRSNDSEKQLRILYVVHNQAMADTVKRRFEVLLEDPVFFSKTEHPIDVLTLSDYGRENLELELIAVIDRDANEAKKFQFEQVKNSLKERLNKDDVHIKNSKIFRQLFDKPEIFMVMVNLIMNEISIAIKGHGLNNDRRRYQQSEKALSRLHGFLNPDERSIVFDVFENYHHSVFEEYGVLDTDDVAISLLGRLRTPVWELKRRELGYDFVFVDETQLFNENERRVLPLLTKGTFSHVPIALALDEAQDVYGQTNAGIATLGIQNITNENLTSIHRSTKSIVGLAFFIIQRSTDLFGANFPDFTDIGTIMENDNHSLAAHPSIEVPGPDSPNLSRFVIKKIRELRKDQLRQIVVICHVDKYWDEIEIELSRSNLPLQILLERGKGLPQDQPLVVLTKPPFVGGQEFDAAILVGLEQSLFPPRVTENEALASAMEQQTYRELYLAITRARYRLLVVVPPNAQVTGILQDARQAGYLR